MAKIYSEPDMGNMSHYDPNLGMRHKPSKAPGKGPKITKKVPNAPKAKRMKVIKNKYPGRFSRGAKATPAPKHGFVPPGTTKVVKKPTGY